MFRLSDIKMKPKLILLFLVAGIVPLVVAGAIGWKNATQALMHKSFEELEAVRDIKKAEMDSFVKERGKDMDTLVEVASRLQHDAFEKLKISQELKKAQLEAFFSEVQSDIQTFSKSEDVLKVYTHIKKYHDDMAFAPDGPYDISTDTYKEIHKNYGRYLTDYAAKHGYDDIFLICASHGHIMFSTGKKIDLGTNLRHGKYKNQGIARLWNKIIETKTTAVEDFSSYLPDNGNQAAFIGTPVFNNSNELLGLIALQLPIEPIHDIVQNLVGMGNTGETYLVGENRSKIAFRSNLRNGKYFIGQEISTPYIEKALANESGEALFTDSEGQLVIAAYDPLDIKGLNWACISKIDIEEAIAPETGEKNIFSQYIMMHEYYDFYLIHPQGEVFYSVAKGKEHGTNMLKGEYSGSGLGRLVKKVLNTKKIEFADFKPYAPDNNKPAAFIAKPLLYNDKIELIAAIQVSIKPINNIMHGLNKMGESGEVYLVGPDYLMRSDSYMDPLNHSVQASFADHDKGKVDTRSVRAALSGKTGRETIEDYRGVQVLSAYAPVKLGSSNVTWALIAEIDEAEVKKAITHMVWNILKGGGTAVLIIIFIAFFIASKIAVPIIRGADFAGSVAKGNFDADMDVNQKDEVGILADALQEMKHNITEVFKEIEELIQGVQEGNLSIRGNADAFTGGWRSLLIRINNLIDTVTMPIHVSAGYIDRISKGDIPEQMTEDYKGDFNEIKDNLNMLISNISETVDVAEKISRGDFSVEIETRSDKDRLSAALLQMIGTLNEITAVTEAVASGDYSRTPEIKGEKDLLGKAVNRMTVNLQKMTEKSKREDWLKTGQNELNQQVRGDQEVTALTRNVLNFLAEYMNLQVGVCYLADEKDKESENEQHFRLVSSYAYHERSNNHNTFRPGQGLIGQAALEKKSILFSNVPQDHVNIRINSGMGESDPLSIFVLPLVHNQAYEDTVSGVLALGSSGTFTQTETQLLEGIAETIAISIHSATARVRMKELLEKTRIQSEELQIQQEELKASNEELEEQTHMLKKSEESLKIQREELQATNEELEEKSEMLEHQKAEIEKKNKNINISRQEIQAKAEELELASKYKSEFLANMSHELRTPLNSLLILAKMLADNEQGNLTKDQIESAKIIQSGGNDLLNLINDILDLSKIEAGKMDIIVQEIAIAGLLRDIRNQFMPVANQKKLEFIIEKADNIPQTINTDIQRIEQILRNLLSNAFKFTRNGSVTLNISFPEPGSQFIFSDLTPGTAISFSVIDTGIGISKNRQKAIFEAFQQADGSTSRKFGGTGLGLTISRELAKKLGGEIQMQSREKQGSCFTLYLPLEKQEGTVSEKSPLEGGRGVSELNKKSSDSISSDKSTNSIKTPPLPPSRGEYVPDTRPSDTRLADDRNTIDEGDKSILVIEDDVRFAQILKDFICKKEYKFLWAENGKTGLELAFKYKPSAIILDIGLPDFSGLRVLDHLKEDLKTRHIPVHIISAGDMTAEPMKKGAVGYLTKPAGPDEIRDVLSGLETRLNRTLKELLIIEDDPGSRKGIINLLKNKDVRISTAETGTDAFNKISTQIFDCVILDLGLPDMTGFELLEKLELEKCSPGKDKTFDLPPIIIYTGRELSKEEHNELVKYAKTIVIKGITSHERLIDEVSLFLHTVESSLPDEQKKIIRMLHDPERILKSKRILLVDDDLRNTFALSRVLGNYGLEIILADNGQLALEKLETEKHIDLILMDIMMPVMDGYEAMKKIRANRQIYKIPIIALTAKAMPEDRARCIDAGANDYLTKPVDEDKMISMLKVWLYESRNKS
ncbi:response regulator [Desulfobacterales bacterium HSG17]|nr:response regulator [Desulfobacterales bacterium HSG17]